MYICIYIIYKIGHKITTIFRHMQIYFYFFSYFEHFKKINIKKTTRVPMRIPLLNRRSERAYLTNKPAAS